MFLSMGCVDFRRAIYAFVFCVTFVTGTGYAYADKAAEEGDYYGSRCPSSEGRCTMDNALERIRERAHKGAKRVIKDTNAEGRVEEVKDTLKECLDCGLDAIKDGMDKIRIDN